MSDQVFFEAWLAAWSAGNPTELLSYYHAQAYYQDPSCPQGLRGHDQLGAYFGKLLKAYPGWKWRLDQLIPGESGWTLRWQVSWPEAWRPALVGLDWIEREEGLIRRNEVYFDASHWPQRAFTWQREDFMVSTDKQRIDRECLLALLADTYWAPQITAAQLDQRIASSLCFGLYYQQQLIGFARALTDQHTLAYLADVVVSPSWRGQGLGSWLVDCALKHPQLQPMRRWLLKTRDAHGVYQKLGFHAPADPGGWLELLADDPRP